MKLMQMQIDLDTVRRVLSLNKPRRICFATTHENALKLYPPPAYGKISVPFKESFYPIFHEITGITLRHGNEFDDYWTPLNENEYELVEEFVNWSGELVYLRDSLALSLALCEYMEDETSRDCATPFL